MSIFFFFWILIYLLQEKIIIFFDIDQMTAISLISLMSQNPLGYHISETEQVRHIVTINVR